MNSDWAVASSGDLFEFPKKFFKNRNYLNERQIYCIEHTTEVTVFTINKYRIVSLPLDRMALQDIKSNSAVKNPLDICSANEEMPYSGQLNTIQKEMPQLLLTDSSASSSLLPESSLLLLLAFVFFFSTIAVMHEKKHTICSLSSKTFSIFLLCSHIFSLLKFPMHIALTAHT